MEMTKERGLFAKADAGCILKGNVQFGMMSMTCEGVPQAPGKAHELIAKVDVATILLAQQED